VVVGELARQLIFVREGPSRFLGLLFAFLRRRSCELSSQHGRVLFKAQSVLNRGFMQGRLRKSEVCLARAVFAVEKVDVLDEVAETGAP
jgi:hypothetical protein